MTSPRTKKLFISYRTSDAPKVDKIARDLALLRYDDGTPRYIIWQDKHNLPPASSGWWDAIVDAIIDNDMFVFNLSRASLESAVCCAQLDYAHRRNRPIVPVVLEGEFLLNPPSDKYDLPKETWSLVPDWLGGHQFLFYVGAEFYSKFQDAVALFERHWPRDLNAPRPLNPDSKSMKGSNHVLYAAACDYAHRLAFADAEKHFDALVSRKDADYADAAAQWLELIRLYAALIDVAEQPSAAFLFNQKLAAYTALFPKAFLEGIFDPNGITTRGDSDAPAPAVQSLGVQPQAVPVTSPAPNPTRLRAIDLLPAPFAWIPIPAGKVTLKTDTGWTKNYIPEGQTQTFDIPAFQIAKYPLTNAQFALFIQAGGYTQDRWWTQAGLELRGQGSQWSWTGTGWMKTPFGQPWVGPRYWQDAKWNQPDYPVVGISWYEAVAYCQWLSEVTGEAIRLPTEQEWQRAAQGDDSREYPWGKEWDVRRCNSDVDNKGILKTTPVRQYEGSDKGDSFFGVVDMAGNVWEWCLTAYESGKIDLEGTDLRVLRGASWGYEYAGFFRCDFRSRRTPDNRYFYGGFRLALL